MGNPRHRSKHIQHIQHRSWFRITIDGKQRVVRPVDGEAWFGAPGLTHGVVHLIDENSDLVSVVEVGFFDRMATRVGGDD